MEKFLTFEDVKQYLVEGDAASEAEQILLKSLKQDDIRNKKLSAEKKMNELDNKSNGKDVKDYRANVLKISDLLDSFDEPMIQRVKRPKEIDQDNIIPQSSANKGISSDFDATLLQDPADIDRAVQDELFRLEELKLTIQRKAQDEKLRLQRQKRLADIQFQKDHPEISKPTAHNELELQKKLLALAEERVLKSAVQRAEIEQKTRELKSLEDGSIPFRQLPTFRNILPSTDNNVNKAAAAASEDQSKPLLANTEMRHMRVQQILNNISNPEVMEVKRKKIQELRAEAMKPPVDVLEDLLSQVSTNHTLLSNSAPGTSRQQSDENIVSSSSSKNLKNLAEKYGSSITSNGKSSSNEALVKKENQPVFSGESKSTNNANNSVNDNPSKPSTYLNDFPLSSSSSANKNAAPPVDAAYSSSSLPAMYAGPQSNMGVYQPFFQPTLYPPQQQQQQQPPPMMMYPQQQQQQQSPLFSWQQQQQQQALQQQMQQIEAENMRLQQQMMFGAGNNGGINNGYMMMPQPRDYLLGNADNFPGVQPLNIMNPISAVDPSFSAPMSNNNNNSNGTLSREERLRREELRRIEFEMEKLKKATELQEFRQQLEQRQRQQREEEEHTRWLETQKRELQRLKMEQVLQKEKRLLEIAQQPLAVAGLGAGALGRAGALSTSAMEDVYRLESIRELCGVAGGIANAGCLSLDMVAGLAVIVDGFMFKVKSQQMPHPFANLLCRVALGIYDRQGRGVVRLSASDWTSFVSSSNNNNNNNTNTNAGSTDDAYGNTSMVQALQPSLLRNIALDWDVNGGAGGGGGDNSDFSAASISRKQPTNNNNNNVGISHAVQLEYHRSKGLRAVIELQVKDATGSAAGGGGGGEVRPLGWAAIPLTRLMSLENSSAGSVVVLNRDCHRLPLRQGLSDPTFPFDDYGNSVNPQQQSMAAQGPFFIKETNAFTSNNNNHSFVDPAVHVLLRIVEKKDFGRATSWQLAQQSQLSTTDITNLYSSQPRVNAFNTNSSTNDILANNGGNNNANSNHTLPPSTPPLMLQPSLSNQSLLSSRTSLQSSQSGKNMATTAAMASPMQLSRPVSSLSAKPDHSGLEASTSRSNLLGNRLPIVPEEDTTAHNTAHPSVKVPPISSSLLSSAVTHAAKERERDRFWLLGAPLSPANDRYQRGDGVDIYIDAARFLPDNVTLTRVSMRIFASNKEQIGPIYEAVCDPKSPAMFPRYHLKAEVRATGSGLINATATALIRIDALDSCNLLPVSVAYTCCKLFCTAPDRLQQPQAASEPAMFVNKGAFQLRLRAGRIPPSLERFSEAMLSDLTVLPCASLLLRIVPAPKSADGISTLSRAEIAREKWQSLGLMVPPPRYDVGGYCGIYAEPSTQEWLAFEAKAKVLGAFAGNASGAGGGGGGGSGAGAAGAGKSHSNGGTNTNSSNQSNGQQASGSGWEDLRSAEAEVLRAMDVIPGHTLPPAPPITNNNNNNNNNTSGNSNNKSTGYNFTDTTIVRRNGAIVEGAVDASAANAGSVASAAASSNNSRMQWWKSLLPAPEQMRRTLDYSILLPYSVETGFNMEIVGLNRVPDDHIFPQLHQPSKGLLSGLFSTTITPGSNTHLYIPKILTSLSPPALLYAEPPLFDGVQANRSWDILRPMQAPRCLDGYISFTPADMSARLFVIADVRFVEVTSVVPPVPPKNKSKAAKTDKKNNETSSNSTNSTNNNNNPNNTDNHAFIDAFKPAGRTRQYWTMFPLARERSPGLGHSYVLSGFVAAPLFEGPVPTDGLFSSSNPYKELVSRLQIGLQEQKGSNGSSTSKANASNKQNSKNANKAGDTTTADGNASRGIRLSEGVSLLVRVVNPLLRDLVAPSVGVTVSGANNNSSSNTTSNNNANNRDINSTATSSTEVAPDMTYLRSLLTAVGVSTDVITSFAAYQSEQEVTQSLDGWRNNARDTTLAVKEAAQRVPLVQLMPKVAGTITAPGIPTGPPGLAVSVLQNVHDYFVQDIGLVKK